MMNDRDIVPLVIRKAGERLTAENTHDSEWKAVPPIVIDNDGTGKVKKCKIALIILQCINHISITFSRSNIVKINYASDTQEDNYRAYKYFSIVDFDNAGAINPQKLFKLIFG
jgi:hypothetical protein